MAIFEYQVRTEAGKLIKGRLDAADSRVAIGRLSNIGYFILRLTERKRTDFFQNLEISLLGRVSKKEIGLFSRQLATMLRAGLPLVTSINTISSQLRNRKLRVVLKEVRESIESGDTLFQSLSKYPHFFSPLYLGMVRVGEESGNLDEVLLRISSFIDKEEDLKNKVKTALTYPVMLITVATGVILFLVMFVFPKFITVFSKAEVPLPLPTQIIFSLSGVLRSHWVFILCGIFVLSLGIKFSTKIKKVREKFDRLRINLPLFGELLRKTIVSRFARSLEFLIRSGVQILASLEITKTVIKNSAFRKVIEKTHQAVQRGEGMTNSLRESKEFPPMVTQMLAVGEETGAMEEMLKEIADSYEQEVDYSIKRLTTVLEPFLIIIMAAIVAFIALSLFLPIFDMIKVIK